MKKHLLFGLLAAAICLSSCNKKNDITKTNKRLIVGTWAPAQERDRVYSLSGVLVLDTTFNLVSTDTATYWNETYNSDGTGKVVNVHSGAVTSGFTYTIDGSVLTDTNNATGLPFYYNILQVSSTKLGLEAQFQSLGSPNSSLNTGVTYNYTSDTYFNKK